MKFGRPWSVKKMRPEARAIAEQAARRAGLPLEDWLHSVIIQQGQAGTASPPLTDDAFHGGEFAAVNDRLDNLSQRIDRLTGTGPAAYAPKRSREQAAGPELPGVRLPQSLDRAMAEIAARQRTLSGRSQEPRRQPPAAPEAPLQPALPAQNLVRLEEQLRNITNQIETLRKPGVEDAINALRQELAEIGRSLGEAMPRRALEAIERQIQNLDQRIVESRQAGIDAGALVGVEHGLAEIRDAMHGLMPAENLIGYTDAVASLAHKIDLIVAQNDPTKIAQLEHAVVTLRELSNRIASNETVSGLAAQVYALNEKIEFMAQAGGAGDGALSHLEQHIAMLSESLAERAHDGGSVSPRLEALVASLAEQVDHLQNARSQGGLGQLEDYIVKLVAKLDASDAKLGHLEGIERGLADLLVGIEAMRANTSSGGAQGTQDVDTIRVDIARTQDTLDALHGTLGHVVERLATIERGIHDRPQAAPGRDAAAARPAYVDDAPSIAAPMAPAEPASAPISPPAQRRMPPSAQLPSDPELPDNQPLEPGSGRPAMQTNAAARIAASEAALGAAAPAAAPAGKSSFIAAARRAAQAAGQQPNPRAQRQETFAASDPQSSLRAKVMKRVKSLFIAASIIAIIIGLVQIAGTVFQFGGPLIKLTDVPATVSVEETKTVDLTTREPEPEATGSVAANPLAPPDLPPLGPLAPVGGSSITTNPPPATYSIAPAMPSLFAPPLLTPKADVTGSIPHPAVTAPVAHHVPVAPPAPPASAAADRLPTAIGGPKLRSAALGGDATAAYAVALRFAEGRGVPANMEEAAFWYERAASKGLVPAQFRYASLLEKGLGVKKDLAQARRLYIAAAGKGNSKAMHNLAVLYAEGIDGKPDYATAVQWFRKAAQHGVADSQYNLGVLCARGLGTAKDYAEAFKWFALAADGGDSEAGKKRDDIAAQLDPAALAAAQQAVKSFVPEPQPQDAVTVHEPAGGWDHAAGAPVRANPRTSPLAFNAGQTGKR